jgi:LPS sulfotransferase NodH
MCLSDWLKLAAANRWRIHPARWAMAGTTTCFAIGNSLLRPLQQLIHGRAIQRTHLVAPPVFILGHWRSGTTYLHELFMRDARFATPTSYQCFQPHHFLLTQALVTRLFWWLMPGKRPMDNVSLDWNSPQEDEFALCALGLPTPYRRMAFPNHGPVDLDYLDMQGLSDGQLARWKAGLDWFVKLMTYHTHRCVLLKSPPHTGRVQVLAEMFPGAKFIHLTRDPYALYSSTLKLWRTLHFTQGFQMSEGSDLEEYIFECLARMYDGFGRQRSAIAGTDIIDIRYEDLVRDPIGELRRVYEHLNLGDFSVVEPQLADYATSKRDYQVNRHQLADALRDEIARRWAFYFQAYGYEK